MITVVTGAPCSGKSTYVKENAKSGDIIIDMDVLALALTTDDVKPYEYSMFVREVAMSARKAAVRRALQVAQGERYLGVWVVHTDPSPDERSMYRVLGGKFHEMNPGLDVCLARLAERNLVKTSITEKVIREWYQVRSNV
jgi:predicted kinase